jgi:hypothetical protein
MKKLVLIAGITGGATGLLGAVVGAVIAFLVGGFLALSVGAGANHCGSTHTVSDADLYNFVGIVTLVGAVAGGLVGGAGGALVVALIGGIRYLSQAGAQEKSAYPSELQPW